MIGIIAAVSYNSVIGIENQIPWDYPEDMKHFSKTTANSVVIMGRKTYEGIGRPLKGRDNFVVSSTLQQTPGIQICSSIPSAMLSRDNSKDLWFIGGASIYQEAMMYANKIVLTIVKEIVTDPKAICFPWICPLLFHTSPQDVEKLTDKLTIVTYHRTHE